MQPAYLVDVQTRHQSHLERLKANEVREFNTVVPTLVAIVLAALNGREVSELTRTEVLRLTRQVSREASATLNERIEVTEAMLAELAGAEAEFERGSLRSALTGVTVAGVAAAAAWRVARNRPLSVDGALLADFLRTTRDRNRVALANLIRRANSEGWTTAAMLAALRGTATGGYRDGLVARIQRSHETVMRTAIQHASSAARAEVWAVNPHIVTGYRWVSVLDSRTSAECRALDGRVFKLGEGPLPPIHMNCRSTVVPELADGLDPAGGVTQESLTTYYAWLDRQPANVQDSILGPTRGKLFREGGLSADEFARLTLSRNFAPLTLEQMRKLAPVAFERAGL